MRTVAIVVQVEDLVAPLCYYAQRILEERHDDEESADCGHVSVMTCVSNVFRASQLAPTCGGWHWGSWARRVVDIRLDRLGGSIEHILDLAGLLPDGIQSVAALRGAAVHAAIAWCSHAVASCVSSHCGHLERLLISFLSYPREEKGG